MHVSFCVAILDLQFLLEQQIKHEKQMLSDEIRQLTQDQIAAEAKAMDDDIYEVMRRRIVVRYVTDAKEKAITWKVRCEVQTLGKRQC